MEDKLYERAKAVIKKHNIASAPFLQRKLYIGWRMACSIIDRLEADGIIGPHNGARLRTIDMSKL
jgi:S-DNA-T family DNA segregation ATPase FtsK/SpoIIIE